MSVVRSAARCCCRQEVLRQNYPSAQPWAVRVVIAFTDTIVAIARCNHPRIGGRALQILAKVLERRRVLRRKRRKVVDGFIDAGGEAGSSHVVAKYAAVDDLREKSALRNQFLHQMRDILLTLRRESFLVACAAAKGDDHNLSFLLGDSGSGQQPGSEKRAS